MLRACTTPVERWCDKTMSVLREQQLEACQDRLSRCPSEGIFGQLCEDEFQKLYAVSYYAREIRRRSPGQEELRRTVLRRAFREMCYVSPREDDLIKRMLMNGGEACLEDWDEISSAEALIARLWCTLRIEDEDTAVLRLAPELIGPVSAAILSSDYTEAREKLFSFDATLHSLLYISGFLHASVPMAHFLRQLGDKADGLSAILLARYLRSGFDYTETKDGDILLLHPGLADPNHLLSNLEMLNPPEIHLTREMMLGGMNGILAEEIASCETMRGALAGAVRPEYDADEALEDLRMMAKQGAALSEMREVLEGMLCVLPTPWMLDALAQLHLQTVRWLGMPSAVLN